MLGTMTGRALAIGITMLTLVACNGPARERARADGLFKEGLHLYYDQKNFSAAGERWEQSLAIYRKVGPDKNGADMLQFLGMEKALLHEEAQSRAYLEEALAAYQKLGIEKGAADTAYLLGLTVVNGDFARSQTYLDYALAAYRELGLEKEVVKTLNAKQVVAQQAGVNAETPAASPAEERQRANALVKEGMRLSKQHDYSGARARWEHALPIYRNLGLEQEAAGVLTLLGTQAGTVGEKDQAQAYLKRALASYRSLRLEDDVADVLYDIGVVAMGAGDYGQARSYLDQALAAYKALGLKKGVAKTLDAKQRVDRLAR